MFWSRKNFWGEKWKGVGVKIFHTKNWRVNFYGRVNFCVFLKISLWTFIPLKILFIIFHFGAHPMRSRDNSCLGCVARVTRFFPCLGQTKYSDGLMDLDGDAILEKCSPRGGLLSLSLTHEWLRGGRQPLQVHNAGWVRGAARHPRGVPEYIPQIAVA